MLLCLGCSSTLSDNLGPSTLPTSSEKPEQPPTIFPCSHAICSGCVRRNRRLAQGCILCQTVDDVLGNGESSASVAKVGGLPQYSETKGKDAVVEEAGDFVLGDSDDEEESPPSPPTASDEEPPAYDEQVGAVDGKAGDDKREQLEVHYLKPQDTLLGLSLQYGVEGRLLCQLNKLPISTLSTTPHLLHTLPFLLLPPSAHSRSSTPLHPPCVERKRLLVRRFQMHTRCSDWAMANAYVEAVLRAREKEAEFVQANAEARGEGEWGGVREGGELEEAVESWERDERWEKGQREGKMGSRIRSTGQVEGKVKGWSWPR